MKKNEKNNDIEILLKKPKYIEIAIIGGIFAIIFSLGEYLFPSETEIKTKVIVCMAIIALSLLIILIIQIIKFNTFYNEYKEQYNYFLNRLNKNDKSNKNIKKMKRDINNIKKQQKKTIWFAEEETWDE